MTPTGYFAFYMFYFSNCFWVLDYFTDVCTLCGPLQVTLEPYERDHAVVCGVYRAAKKKD